MKTIPDKHLEKLQQHGAVWRFIRQSKGFRAALCYVDEKRLDVDVVETEDFCLASVKEKELSATITFANSIDDLLEDRKRYHESLWGRAAYKPLIEFIPIRQWRGKNKPLVE